MSGALTRAIHTLDEIVIATDKSTEVGTTIIFGTSSTTVVLTGIGLVVTIVLAVVGWIILGRRNDRDRTADATNNDLNALIRLLHGADIEVRRVAALPHPAGPGDFHEITRLIPHIESHGAQASPPLETLVGDVTENMQGYTRLPVDGSTPIGELAVRIRQQTRTADGLLAAIAKALTSARQMRN
ncbi:hypothetical protein [Streptomyces sp. NPDC000878]